MSKASRQAGRQAGSAGLESTARCCVVCWQLRKTHRPEQMAAEEGDRLTDENCWGYPTWEFSQAEREKLT